MVQTPTVQPNRRGTTRYHHEDTRPSLLIRVRDGGDDAWAEFTRIYEPLVMRFVCEKGFQQADAEDIKQDVFVKLLRAMRTFVFDKQRGRFRTWLWRVTWNTMEDRARSRFCRRAAETRWVRELIQQAPAPDAEPDDGWVTEYRKRVFAAALDHVRAKSRAKTWECFVQHLHLGRPCKDVGEELNLTANAVTVNAYRVFKRIEEQCVQYKEPLSEA